MELHKISRNPSFREFPIQKNEADEDTKTMVHSSFSVVFVQATMTSPTQSVFIVNKEKMKFPYLNASSSSSSRWKVARSTSTVRSVAIFTTNVAALMMTRTTAFPVPMSRTSSILDASCSRSISSVPNSVLHLMPRFTDSSTCARHVRAREQFWNHGRVPVGIHGNGSSKTKLNMFGELFRAFNTAGGAYNLRIDYTDLEFPGPELGQWAQDGIVPTHSTQHPNLELATFAGGCFW